MIYGTNTWNQQTFTCLKSTIEALEKVDTCVSIVDFYQANFSGNKIAAANKVSYSFHI